VFEKIDEGKKREGKDDYKTFRDQHGNAHDINDEIKKDQDEDINLDDELDQKTSKIEQIYSEFLGDETLND